MDVNCAIIVSAMVFSLFTYNMHGFSNGHAFLSANINNYQFACIQEHWLHSFELLKFNCFDGYNYLAISSMNADVVGNPGRPYGGLAILYPSTTRVLCHRSSADSRVLASKFMSGNSTCIVVNVYMPCISNSIDYVDQCTLIAGFIDDFLNEFGDEQAGICIAGDFNCNAKDFLWHDGAVILGELFGLYDLMICDQFYSGPVNYTFRCAARNVFSWLDHVFVKTDWLRDMTEVTILDAGDNNSDHCIHGVILPNVCTDTLLPAKQPESQVTFDQFTRYNWCEENCNLYYSHTSNLLLNMHEVLSVSDAIYCTNNMCSDSSHLSAIETFTSDVIRALVQSSRHCVEIIHKRNKVPWSSELANLKRCSVQAHNEWVVNGKPHSGDIWQCKVAAHSKYKRAIKLAKSKAKGIFSENLLNNLLTKNAKKFWSCWRSKTDHSNVQTSDTLSADAFAEKF